MKGNVYIVNQSTDTKYTVTFKMNNALDNVVIDTLCANKKRNWMVLALS